jgi:hypothetical protein
MQILSITIKIGEDAKGHEEPEEKIAASMALVVSQSQAPPPGQLRYSEISNHSPRKKPVLREMVAIW